MRLHTRALLAMVGWLLLAGAAPVVAQTHTWVVAAEEVETATFKRSETDSGDSATQIAWANTQIGLAGRVLLKAGATANAKIFKVTGDRSKFIALTTDASGHFRLEVAPGGGETPLVATGQAIATPGLYRFALFFRRGNGTNGGSQLVSSAIVIIDGAETLSVGSTSVTYADGPFRGVEFGGTAGNRVSARIWSVVESDLSGVVGALAQAVETEAAAFYPIADSQPIRWSNLEDTDSPKAYYFTKGSGAFSLCLPATEAAPAGKRIIVTQLKIANNSANAMQSTLSINGATSSEKSSEAFSASYGSYTFDTCIVYDFPTGQRPIVQIGATYPITSTGDNLLSAIKAKSPISISGLSGDWVGYNGYCAVEGLLAEEPTATLAEVVVSPGEGHTGGGSVSATLEAFSPGSFAEADLSFVLTFGGAVPELVTERVEKHLSFTLPPETFLAGKVYRGTLILRYPEGELPLAAVKIYEGEAQIVPYPGWIDEQTGQTGQTGQWEAPEGLGTYKTWLEADADGGVRFLPNLPEDYVALCDSTFTVRLHPDETFAEADEESGGPAADVQGAVRVVEAEAGLQVQVATANGWEALCAAEAGQTYEVEVAFHYAKPGVEGDADRVTYRCAEATVVSARRAEGEKRVSEIWLADGTQVEALLGMCELDKAVVVDVEILPGEQKTLAATDAASAQAEAERLTIAIGEAVAEVVRTESEQAAYRAYLKVVAKERAEGGYVAEVVFTDVPERLQELEEDLAEAIRSVAAGFSTDAEAAAFTGRPGLYYRLVHGDSPGALTEREAQVMANAEGHVSLTVSRPANSTGHFYRVVCTPQPDAE